MEKINGQCETCGADYALLALLDGSPIICPACKAETQNWDTVSGSQMAPFIVEIVK
jgi:Zn finger protein HypA/HybF involved in hydrogenase expression